MITKRTKSFVTTDAIWNRYPGMKLVCLSGTGLDNQTRRQTTDQFFQSKQLIAFESMRSVDFDTFPPFAEWRRIQPGPDFPAAHEALGKRVASGKMLKNISPFVDWYNACCLDLLAKDIAAPVGAWCSDAVPGLSLFITAGGEPFTELGGKARTIRAEAGETAYVDVRTSELITRHFVWRQSQHGAIKSQSSSFFLVSEIIQAFADHADAVREELVETCERLFSIKTKSAIVTADRQRWDWIEEQ